MLMSIGISAQTFTLKSKDLGGQFKAKQYATEGDFLSRYSNIFLPLVSLATFVLGISLK